MLIGLLIPRVYLQDYELCFKDTSLGGNLRRQMCGCLLHHGERASLGGFENTLGGCRRFAAPGSRLCEANATSCSDHRKALLRY